jgi:hypothetical protein
MFPAGRTNHISARLAGLMVREQFGAWQTGPFDTALDLRICGAGHHSHRGSDLLRSDILLCGKNWQPSQRTSSFTVRPTGNPETAPQSRGTLEARGNVR